MNAQRTGWVVGTLEALYAGPRGVGRDFGSAVLEAMAPGLDDGCGVGFSLVDLTAERWHFFEVVAPDGQRMDWSSMPYTLGFPPDQAAPLFKQLYGSSAPFSLLSALLGLPSLEGHPALAQIREMVPDVVDSLGLPSMPAPSLGLCGFAGLRKGSMLAPQRVALLTRLSFHLETSVRQRLRSAGPVGLISTSGKLELDRPLGSLTEATLSSQVQAIERLRLSAYRGDDEGALETWKALTAGVFSLVERVDADGRRQYEVYENPPRAVTTLALSDLEHAVISQACRSITNKEVGYALGLNASQVSRALHQATERLGLTSERDLLRLAAQHQIR
jgi:DNA-binding CsgD family transcriptional regulator